MARLRALTKNIINNITAFVFVCALLSGLAVAATSLTAIFTILLLYFFAFLVLVLVIFITIILGILCATLGSVAGALLLPWLVIWLTFPSASSITWLVSLLAWIFLLVIGGIQIYNFRNKNGCKCEEPASKTSKREESAAADPSNAEPATEKPPGDTNSGADAASKK